MVCNIGVGSNSIKCTSCEACIHKKFSGILGKLQIVGEFCCRTCATGPVQLESLEKLSLNWKVAKI